MATDQITSSIWQNWSSVWLTDNLWDVLYVYVSQEAVLGCTESPQRDRMTDEGYNKYGIRELLNNDSECQCMQTSDQPHILRERERKR